MFMQVKLVEDEYNSILYKCFDFYLFLDNLQELTFEVYYFQIFDYRCKYDLNIRSYL